MTNYLFISNSSDFKIDNNIINQINSILHSENIQFTNREIKKNDFYEWILNKKIVKSFTRERIKKNFINLPIDINFLEILSTRKKKLLICDMDSTIIKEESLDEIAEEAGIGDEIKNITKRAMKGDLDFKDALFERIKLLNNYPLANIFTLNTKIQLKKQLYQLILKQMILF